MSFQPVDVVRVVLWGKQVGAVALDPRLGFYAFEYDPHFIRSGIQPAPLTVLNRSNSSADFYTWVVPGTAGECIILTNAQQCRPLP